MNITTIEHPKMFLAGLKIRTNNFTHEANPAISKISPLVQRFYAENIAEKIPNRKNPGVGLVGYSNYQSDEYGDYDFHFGEEVSSLENLPEWLAGLTIPAGKYLKISSDVGQMPAIAVETWQKIWTKTKDKTLPGTRLYQVDFEIHDKAPTEQGVSFDIYLGIK